MENIPILPVEPPITSSVSANDIDTETPSEPVVLEEWQVSDGTTTHGWSDHHQIETEEERNRHPATNGPPSPVQIPQPQPQPPNLTVAATGPNNRDGSSERSTSDEYLVEPVETEAGPGSTRPTNEEQTPTQTSPNRQTSPSKIARPAPLPLPIHSSSWAPNLHRAAEQTLAAASKRRWN
mmetsp:Transcript_5572/g.6851  ORF Transcript_5572/g.6851 Transcript_5572/m.6851 type:complete len:180 (+) Transcript_5572:205-744(+)